LHRSREEVIRLAIEEAIMASQRHVFAVLFWFIVLPHPCGAVLYRLAAYMARRWSGRGEFGRFAAHALYVLEWPAARLTAASFAVVGDFEDAVYCWRTQAAAWPDRNMGIVLAAGAGELGLGEAADAPLLDSAVGLLWRALVLWVFVLIVLSLVRLF